MFNIEKFICCPYCANHLSFGDRDCVCSGCDKKFPVILGILDLRVPLEGAWVDFEEDRLIALSLAEKYPSHSFEQLVAEVWNKRQNVPPEIVKRRIRGITQATAKYEADLADKGWIGSLFSNPAESFCIELGCGPGGFLEAAIPRFNSVVGVDISLMWLVVAKKRLEEKGLDCTIVCACIEHLPFKGDLFDLTVAFDVIEHVTNPQLIVEAIHHITRPGGKVVCTTPNRFSLSAEPHVGVWGVGFLPRRWMQSYVRWRNGMFYQHTYPQSLLDLRRYFKHASRFEFSIKTPTIWEKEVEGFSPIKRALAKLYNWVIGVGFFRFILLPIAPFFQIVAQKTRG